MRPLLLLTLIPVACTPDDPSSEPAFCVGRVAHRYDPESDELLAFPDDAWTVVDEASPTGLTVDLGPETPWIASLPDLLRGLVDGIDGLSGYARLGGAVLRFDGDVGDVPSGSDESVGQDGLVLLDLDATPPARRAYRTRVEDQGRQVVVEPLHPLASGRRHALVMTTAHAAAGGGCVAPSEATRALLTGRASGRLARVADAVPAVLGALDLVAEDVSALLVFTAHDGMTRRAEVIADVAVRDASWTARPVCEPDGSLVRCRGGLFPARDYRDPVRAVAVPATSARAVPVDVWLPSDVEGPFPLVIFGHGINSGRGEGSAFARFLAPLGFAVASADAVQHGEHPDNDAGIDALGFLGIDILGGRLDGRALRGAFDQTVIDRAQLVATLRRDPDVDGDGTADIDPERFLYWGVSLGGMLGPGLLSLDDGFDAAILSVAGGRLIDFALENQYFAPIRPLLEDLAGGPDGFSRMLLVGQAAVDPADPAVYAAHVLADRMVGERAPDVLLPVSVYDDTVPPSTAQWLARGFGLAHVGPVHVPVDGLEVLTAPVSGNVGGVTAGYYQFEVVNGAEPSSHGNTPLSTEGWAQAMRFLETTREGRGVIVDPFAE